MKRRLGIAKGNETSTFRDPLGEIEGNSGAYPRFSTRRQEGSQ